MRNIDVKCELLVQHIEHLIVVVIRQQIERDPTFFCPLCVTKLSFKELPLAVMPYVPL